MRPTLPPSVRQHLEAAQAQAGRHMHLDEVFIRIHGKLHYFWRAVDQHGVVPDILMQNRRSAVVPHQPARQREQQVQWLKSARHAQRFLSAHGRIHNRFQLGHHGLTAGQHRAARDHAVRTWREVAGTVSPASRPDQPQALGGTATISLPMPLAHPLSST